MLLVGLIAHQLNNLFNRHGFFGKNSFLPGFIYGISLCSFDQLHFSLDLVAHLFLIFALMYLLEVRRQEPAKALIFKAGLLIGVSMIISPFYVILVLVPWITLILFRPFVWREYFMMLLAIALPLIYYWAINFLATGEYLVQLNRVEFVAPEIVLGKFELISWILYGCLILFSAWRVLVISSTEVVRYKKQTQLMFNLLWTTASMAALQWLFFESLITAILIPFAIMIGITFLNVRREAVVNITVVIWFIISGLNLFI